MSLMKVGTNSDVGLPAGFPSKQSGPLCWTATDFVSDESYVVRLDDIDIVQIEEALRSFQRSNLPLDQIDRASFYLPLDLEVKLRSLSKTVHNGRGFVVLRGLDPTKYTEEQNLIIYGGIVSYVGQKRADLVHVLDLANGDKGAASKARYAPNQMSTAMNFHNDVDAGDILSLYTLALPLAGGQQRVVSFPTVYNVLSATHPEVLHALAQPWHYNVPRFGHMRTIVRPVIYFVEDRLQINFGSSSLAGAAHLPRAEGTPEIDPERLHAMHLFLDACRQYSMPVSQMQGDLMFVNNLAILHAREPFTDDLSIGKQRHLFRMMLQDPILAWKKPEQIEQYVVEKFDQREIPKFFGNLKQYEVAASGLRLMLHD